MIIVNHIHLSNINKLKLFAKWWYHNRL